MDEQNDFADRLERRGVKATAMRCLVYRSLYNARNPLSLREVEDLLVTGERSTIFRTLTLLVKHGLVHAIEDGSGALKYEACRGDGACSISDQHPHFYCESCGHTYCLHDVHIPVVELSETFYVHTINYLIKGICPKCSGES